MIDDHQLDVWCKIIIWIDKWAWQTANGRKHFMSVDYTSISSINMHRFGWVINNNYNVCLFSWNGVHFSNNNNKITIDCIWMVCFLKSFPLSFNLLILPFLDPSALSIATKWSSFARFSSGCIAFMFSFIFFFSYSFCFVLFEIVWEI